MALWRGGITCKLGDTCKFLPSAAIAPHARRVFNFELKYWRAVFAPRFRWNLCIETHQLSYHL